MVSHGIRIVLLNQVLPYSYPRVRVAFRYDQGWNLAPVSYRFCRPRLFRSSFIPGFAYSLSGFMMLARLH
jgi:hypothetical protein